MTKQARLIGFTTDGGLLFRAGHRCSWRYVAVYGDDNSHIVLKTCKPDGVCTEKVLAEVTDSSNCIEKAFAQLECELVDMEKWYELQTQYAENEDFEETSFQIRPECLWYFLRWFIFGKMYNDITIDGQSSDRFIEFEDTVRYYQKMEKIKH